MDDAKRLAARAALDGVPKRDGTVVGLGSGSTARMFVEELGALVRDGLRIVGVPTSESTRALAQSVGIPLLSDEGPWEIDVCIDGADEVSSELDLIKGGGAAHTREKIVNFASDRNIIIVDDSKLSQQLGERWSVPIEVLPFAHLTTREHLARLGNPMLRRKDGAAVRTDSGNLIYDLETGPIEDAGDLDAELHIIPGVVETGLFVARADVVIVASAHGVRKLER
jgi:ribose 5-phosphate isomerase A